MRCIRKKVAVFGLAAALAIPMMGISASAQMKSDVITVKEAAVQKDWGTRDMFDKDSGKHVYAATNGNGSIAYLGDYDLAAVSSIDVVASINQDSKSKNCGVKFTYEPILEDEIVDGDYLGSKHVDIRSSGKTFINIIGQTSVSKAIKDKVGKTGNDDYIGAKYTVTGNTVTVDEEAFQAQFDADSSATTNTENAQSSSSLADKANLGKVHLFVYGTAQGGRVCIDTITIHYEAPDTYNLTIDGQAYNEIEYNSKVTVTAPEKKGEQVFSHWTKNGEPISYDRSYEFYASGNDTIEAVYADTAPEAKACYYISWKQEGDDLIFIAECNFPAGVSDGRVIIAPNADPKGEALKSPFSNTDSGEKLSGTNQYRVKLGSISQFDAEKFDECRIKFEGMYSNKSKIAFDKNKPTGMYFWFTEPNNGNDNHLKIDTGNVTPGFKATTF